MYRERDILTDTEWNGGGGEGEGEREREWWVIALEYVEQLFPFFFIWGPRQMKKLGTPSVKKT